MTNILAPVAKSKFFGNDGKPAANYLLFTYEAGTDTKAPTYPSANSVSQNPNPLPLDFRGEGDIWIPPNVAYKFVFCPPTDTDPPTAPIWTVDDIVSSQLVTLYGGVDTGNANAYVLDFVANFTAYQDGIVIYWIPSNTNSGPSTIDVNGLGPVSIVSQSGAPLVAKQIIANNVSQIIYSGTGFKLLSSFVAGQFNGTLTGMVTPVVVAINYRIVNGVATLSLDDSALHIGTSNSTSMTMTGAPNAIWPSQERRSYTACRNNSAFAGAWGIIDSGGVITFDIPPSGFSSSGTKGLSSGWNMVYPL